MNARAVAETCLSRLKVRFPLAERAATSSTNMQRIFPPPLKSAAEAEVDKAKQAKHYIYSQSVLRPPIPRVIGITNPEPRARQLDILQWQHPAARYYAHFAGKNSSEAVQWLPGSVMNVQLWNELGNTSAGSTSFTGVMLDVRRRNGLYSFLLRGLIEGTPVEQRFQLGNPKLKHISLVRTPPPSLGEWFKDETGQVVGFGPVPKTLYRLRFNVRELQRILDGKVVSPLKESPKQVQ